VLLLLGCQPPGERSCISASKPEQVLRVGAHPGFGYCGHQTKVRPCHPALSAHAMAWSQQPRYTKASQKMVASCDDHACVQVVIVSHNSSWQRHPLETTRITRTLSKCSAITINLATHLIWLPLLPSSLNKIDPEMSKAMVKHCYPWCAGRSTL